MAYCRHKKKTITYKGVKLTYTGGRLNQKRSFKVGRHIIWIPLDMLDGFKLKRGADIDDLLIAAGVLAKPKDEIHDYALPAAITAYQPPDPGDIMFNEDEIVNGPTEEDNITLPKNPNEYVYIPAKKPYSIIMKVSFLRRVGFLK